MFFQSELALIRGVFKLQSLLLMFGGLFDLLRGSLDVGVTLCQNLCLNLR